MHKGYENKCVRCGKDRIVADTRKEQGVNNLTITFIKMVCPDKDCQAIVDAENEAKMLKQAQIAQRKENFAKSKLVN